MIRIESREHIQQPFNVWLVGMGDIEPVYPLKELSLFLGYFQCPIIHLLQKVHSPLLFLLELIQHCLDHETFERRLRAWPEPHFLIQWDIQFALLSLQDVLDRVDGAVEVPHVEAVPHIGLVPLLLRQFGHFDNLMCFLKL